MIELRQASKIYTGGAGEVRAVDRVSLQVAAGDFISVVGHSGSGKTTLVSLMGGLTKPGFGQVLIDGIDIWTLSNKELARLRSAKIGFCFQFASLIPTLDCRDNVRLPSSFIGRAGAGERARQLLERVGLPDKVGSYPGELSGGQQRRVAIARALINQPEIILADEPTGDLDEATEADIMELFAGLNGEGVTIVMVTHSRRLAAQAQRSLTMVEGRVTRLTKFD